MSKRLSVSEFALSEELVNARLITFGAEIEEHFAVVGHSPGDYLICLSKYTEQRLEEVKHFVLHSLHPDGNFVPTPEAVGDVISSVTELATLNAAVGEYGYVVQKAQRAKAVQ